MRKLLAPALLFALVSSAPSFAIHCPSVGSGNEGAETRALSAPMQAAVDRQVAAVRKALPPAPAGWEELKAYGDEQGCYYGAGGKFALRWELRRCYRDPKGLDTQVAQAEARYNATNEKMVKAMQAMSEDGQKLMQQQQDEMAKLSALQQKRDADRQQGKWDLPVCILVSGDPGQVQMPSDGKPAKPVGALDGRKEQWTSYRAVADGSEYSKNPYGSASVTAYEAVVGAPSAWKSRGGSSPGEANYEQVIPAGSTAAKGLLVRVIGGEPQADALFKTTDWKALAASVQ